MSVAGTYDCTVKSPMGDQNGTLTVVPNDDGTAFTGSMSSGMMGSMDIDNGTIDGNAISWKMSMTSPMPMDLDCSATVDDGGALSGEVKAGAFGSMALTGQRQG
ncbi:MAG: hypothetical protein R3D89_06705 [Sphingomonadaceae bacterium]